MTGSLINARAVLINGGICGWLSLGAQVCLTAAQTNPASLLSDLHRADHNSLAESP